MADTETVETVTETVAEAVNGTAKVPATPEGMMVAYGSLVIMALIPIFLGSFRSVDSQKEQKDNHVRIINIISCRNAMFKLSGENWRTS